MAAAISDVKKWEKCKGWAQATGYAEFSLDTCNRGAGALDANRGSAD